jgi:tetraacyldisaccharide 4'-kinase
MSRLKIVAERIRRRIESIAKDDGPSAPLGIETGLQVLSILYGAVMAIRARLYETGRLPSRSLPCRVVSVGNITAGGTGKTPMTIFVAQTISGLGYRVVVISRGYKGRMEHSGGVVSDGRTLFHGPEAAGDEPYLMATALTGIPVVVGGDRYQAGMLAMQRFAPDVIVLDDAFQHLRLRRDIDLVLLDHHAPLGNGHLLPRGRLREPLSALGRAHALIFTRCPPDAPFLRPPPWFRNRPVFYTFHVPVFKVTRPPDGFSPEGMVKFSSLQGKPAVAFSGLADNDQFFESLEQSGCRLVHRVAFGDHHRYGADDIDRVVRQAVASSADLLITTLKDWVKIQHQQHWPLPIIAVDVRIGWHADSGRFDNFLSTALASTVTPS